MRKFGVFLLSVILFISLLGLASSTSSNIAFTHPAKIKSWLNQSNLYGNFVSNAVRQAQQTAGGDQSGAVSLSDTVVQQTAQSTFSSQLLQKDVNTFVDSNYKWLEGKSSKPDFRVDLTEAKQTFAERVGKYVQTYLTGLPVCSATQLSELDPQTTDPLTLTCRPASIDPGTEAAQVTDTIANSGAFLSDPIITASTIDPKGNSESQPYYQNLSGLPKVYQLGTKLPLITGAVAIASTIGVIFISKRRRNGLRSFGIVLLLAGLVLVITKFTSDQIFNKVQHHVFNNTDVGQLQKALTAFMHHAEDQLTKVDLWFGLAYLIIALVILIVLVSTRSRDTTPSILKDEPELPEAASQPEAASPTNIPGARPGQRKPGTNPSAKPIRRKPPRLVQ